MLNLKNLFLVTILLELLRFGEAYIITVDAREEECFFERGPKMSKFHFERVSAIHPSIQSLIN